MSRHLPARANLEYLKKQAKHRLSDLQQQTPDSRLADAQHAIAREYGFLNWASLKAHVESQPSEAPSPFGGVWRAAPGSGPETPATIEFHVAGDVVTVTDVRADAAGRAERAVNTLTADGLDRASGPGYVMAARWIGSHGLEATARQDGRVVGRVTYDVSADDRTLTIASESRAHAGYPASTSRAIFVRA